MQHEIKEACTDKLDCLNKELQTQIKLSRDFSKTRQNARDLMP